MGEMIKRIFGDIQTDLGNLEGDYRVAHLRADISQSILYMFIISVSTLLMLIVDAFVFNNNPHLLLLMVLFRIGYAIVTVATGIVIYRTTRVRNYDRWIFAWILFTIIFMLLISYTRPANYISAPFDVIIPFAIYLLSPLKIKQTFALALAFSLGALYVDFFYKSGVDHILLDIPDEPDGSGTCGYYSSGSPGGGR